MKLLRKGQEKQGQWWVGRAITCPRCGQMVELEKDDDHGCQFFLGHTHEVVRIACANCGEEMEAGK